MFDPKTVLDSIGHGIVAINGEGLVCYLNEAAERRFQVPAGEARGRSVLEVFPQAGEQLLHCLKTGKAVRRETLPGLEGTLLSAFHPLWKEGEVVGAVGSFQDIPEDDLFRNIGTWLDAIIDSSYDGLWICDHQGKVIRINKASERISGVKREEVVGRHMKDLIAEGLFDRSVSLEVLKKKTAITLIQQVKGGKKILVTGNPILNGKGEVAFVVTNERDITELNNLRNRLEETQSLAQEYISKISELELKGAHLPALVFRSSEMRRILETVLRVAKVNSTVLLLGESGVGKGLLAKLIHKNSTRSKWPFLRVDCAGIPDTLIESELFGYERGAFTGAKPEGKPGFFELANQGTIFLDEIGEIPLSSQSKLLRFLEDHEIVRIGGQAARKIDVRIIAATNRNIEEMVSAKLFREDLYYRLNVVPFFIPPLRDRRDDIPPLISFFLDKFNKEHKKEKVFSPEALEFLFQYDYPGNIRELANIIERLVVVTGKNHIEGRDIPQVITGASAKSGSNSFAFEGLPLKEALKKCEKVILERVMKKCGSQQEAARALQVDQATISRKLRQHARHRDAILHD